MQDVRVHTIRRQLHVAHDGAADEAVFHRLLHSPHRPWLSEHDELSHPGKRASLAEQPCAPSTHLSLARIRSWRNPSVSGRGEEGASQCSVILQVGASASHRKPGNLSGDGRQRPPSTS